MAKMGFGSLRSFASHMKFLVKREQLADTEARGVAAHELTVEIQRRFGKSAFFPPPLKPATMLRHRLHGVLGGAQGGNTPLLLTGALRQSISWSHTGPRSSGVGTDSPYAKYHEFGGSIPGRPPKRSFLAKPARQLDRVLFASYRKVYFRFLGF